jgi:hypothetical protein
MRQHAFEALHQAFWQQFELDLGKLEQKRQLKHPKHCRIWPALPHFVSPLGLGQQPQLFSRFVSQPANLGRPRPQATLPTQKFHTQTIHPVCETHLAANLPPRKSRDCVGPLAVLRAFVHLPVVDLASPRSVRQHCQPQAQAKPWAMATATWRNYKPRERVVHGGKTG